MQERAPAEHGLHRPLSLRDLVLAQILCVVGSSWVGVAAGLGQAQAVLWVSAMLVFYVPMAAAVVCLNRRMPLEGGLYVWAREAFGDLGGFLAAWNIWVYGIAVVASILYAIPTELSYLIGPAANWLPESRMASLAIVAGMITLLTLAALRGLELGKWIQNVGGVAMMVAFAGLVLLPLWPVLHHHALYSNHAVHYNPFPVAAPAPTLQNFALFGELLFGALCGLEYVAITAGESRDPARTIGRSVMIASPVICAMFILGTASVVAIVPHGSIDFIAPIPQAMRLVLGTRGVGNVAAISVILLLQLRLIGATSFLFTGVTRLPMAAGWNHLVPEWFTRLHPVRRTPTNSILFTAALAMALVVLGTAGVHAQEAYQLMANASLTHYEVAYLFMFAIPVVGAAGLRRTLPRWLKWVSAVGFVATCFSLVISACPFVKVVSPWAYAAKILVTIVLSNLAAVVFYRLRTRGTQLSAGPVSEAT